MTCTVTDLLLLVGFAIRPLIGASAFSITLHASVPASVVGVLPQGMALGTGRAYCPSVKVYVVPCQVPLISDQSSA